MHKWIDCIGQIVQYIFFQLWDGYYYYCRCCALLAFHWNGILIVHTIWFLFFVVRSVSSSFKYSSNEWSVLNLEFQSMSNGMVIQLNGNCSVWMNGYKICIDYIELSCMCVCIEWRNYWYWKEDDDTTMVLIFN